MNLKQNTHGGYINTGFNKGSLNLAAEKQRLQ